MSIESDWQEFYDARSKLYAAHDEVVRAISARKEDLARTAAVDTEVLKLRTLLSAWASILPPNGHLYFEHVKRARQYFAEMGIDPDKFPAVAAK